MSLQAARIHEIPAGQPVIIEFDMTDDLADGETLVSVTQATAETGITLGTTQVNAVEFENPYEQRTVEIGKGVQIAVTNSTAGEYRINIVATSSRNNPGARKLDWIGQVTAK